MAVSVTRAKRYFTPEPGCASELAARVQSSKSRQLSTVTRVPQTNMPCLVCASTRRAFSAWFCLTHRPSLSDSCFLAALYVGQGLLTRTDASFSFSLSYRQESDKEKDAHGAVVYPSLYANTFLLVHMKSVPASYPAPILKCSPHPIPIGAQ